MYVSTVLFCKHKIVQTGLSAKCSDITLFPSTTATGLHNKVDNDVSFNWKTVACRLSPFPLFVFPHCLSANKIDSISTCYYICLVGSCQCRLNSALESCGTGVLTGVIVLAVSQIND